MNTTSLLGYIFVLIIGASGGYLYAVAPSSPAHDAHDSMSAMEGGHMEHPKYEVPSSIKTPTVTLSASADTKEGWNLHIVTTNFTFTPEQAGGANVPGTGHAHVYVDGVKVGRAYGSWYYLGALPEGKHTITVSLNTNDHMDYVSSGKAIESSVDVVSPKKVDTSMSMGATKTFDLMISGRKITSGPSTLSVTQGDSVTITVVDMDEDEELHLHGYNTSVEFKKGEKAQLTFTADASGRFPMELEGSKTELGALEVSPR